jgi:hypothetical protein
MRLFEISLDNDTYLKMRCKEELQIVVSAHNLISTKYNKLINGYQFANNSQE